MELDLRQSVFLSVDSAALIGDDTGIDHEAFGGRAAVGGLAVAVELSAASHVRAREIELRLGFR